MDYSREKAGNYSKVNKINEYLQFLESPDKVLITCTFNMNQITNHCSRTYKKIQDVLAEVGGLANAGLAIMLVAITPYLNLKFRESLVNELFDFHPSYQNTNQNKTQKTKKRGVPAKNKRNGSPGRENKARSIQRKDPTKIDDFQTDTYKSNPTQEPQQTKSALFSPATKTRAKGNVNTAWNDIKSEGETYSPIAGVSSKNSPMAKKEDQGIAFIKHQISGECLDLEESVQKSEVKKIQIKKTSEIELERSPKKKDAPMVLTLANQQKLIMLNQKMVSEGDEDKHNDIEAPSFVSEVFSNCALEPDNQAANRVLFQPEISKDEDEEKGNITIQMRTNHKKDPSYNRSPSIDDYISEGNKNTINSESQKISLTLWEYLSSFFYQSEVLRQKMEILTEGIAQIDARLDVINIMKKFREVDKIKAMLLDYDQLVLFENLPKPQIKPRGSTNQTLYSHHNLLRKATFIEHNHTSSKVFDAHAKIEVKAKKSKIDQRLIEIFKEKV